MPTAQGNLKLQSGARRAARETQKTKHQAPEKLQSPSTNK
jgi:hypothetical protein